MVISAIALALATYCHYYAIFLLPAQFLVVLIALSQSKVPNRKSKIVAWLIAAFAPALSLVPPEARVSGPGTSAIMAAFTHLNPVGDRFTDGSYGVFYAGRTLATAIAETRYHRTQFLEATDEPAQELDMRVYAIDLDASLHDIRGQREALPALYQPSSYAASQETARTLRDAGSDGIVYESVRDPGGECAAVFRARLLSNCRQERHLCYVWDGSEVRTVYEKRLLDS